MPIGPASSRPLHTIGLAIAAALWLVIAFTPAAVLAETPEETEAYLRSSGFACQPVSDVDGIACERQFGASDTDRDQVSLFTFETGRSAGVGRASYGEPWDIDIESVAVHMVEVVCPGLGARVPGIVAQARASTPPQELEEIVGPCRIRAETTAESGAGRLYRSVGVEIFSDVPAASDGPSADGGAAARAAILADLQAAGWTCTDDVVHDDGSPYDGTECRSGETGDEQDVVRIARAGSVEVYSEITASASGDAPWTPAIDAFARAIVEFECPGTSGAVAGFVERLAAGEPQFTERIGTCLFNPGRFGQTADGVPVVTIFSVIANSSAPVVVEPSPGDGARGELLARLLATGWTCTDDAEEFDGSRYDGTECRSGDADERDRDIVRVARQGAVDVRSGVLASSMAPALAPWTPTLDAIAVDIVEMACPGAGGQVAGLIASAEAGQDAAVEVPPCFLDVGRGGTMVGDEERVRTYLLSVVSSVPFAAGPLPSAGAPGATPQPGGAGGPGPGPDEGGPAAVTPAFAEAVPAPGEVETDPAVVATSALLAVLAVLLVPFPGMLFNSTLESNYDEVRGWFRRRPRRPRRPAVADGDPGDGQPSTGGGVWTRPLGLAVFLLLSAALYGFLDPGFGSGPATVPMFLGTVLGLVAVSGLAFAAPWLGHARLGERGRLRALPGTLVVAAVCVLVSRLTGFLPGYLYGLLIALEFARTLGRDEGRLAALSAATLLAAAGVAWLVIGLLPADGGDAVGAIVRTALSAIVVAGLEGVVFGLVPLRFLPGAAVFTWSRVAWAGLYAIGVFGFLHVLLDPAGGYLASSARTPLVTIVALLVGFGLVSVVFWGYFRFRPDRPAPADPAATGQSEAPPS